MAAIKATAPATTRRARILVSYRKPPGAAVRHPASWLFLALCALSLGYLIYAGYAGLLPLVFGTLAGTALLVAITISLTRWHDPALAASQHRDLLRVVALMPEDASHGFACRPALAVPLANSAVASHLIEVALRRPAGLFQR